MAACQTQIIFRSCGKTGCVNADGSGLRYLEFEVPDQVTWSAVDGFGDGRRLLMSSMENRQDGPGRPFGEYYHRTRVRMWIYDLESGSLQEIEDTGRTEPFTMPLLVFPDQARILFQVVGKGSSRIFSMSLDGGNCQELTHSNDGFPYGFTVSPNGRRIAFHVSGPSPHAYRIFTANLDGSDLTLVAGETGHLYFGPTWSPDGNWLLYCDMHPHEDPGHNWADLCIARPDSTGQRNLTEGAPHWMTATYGNPANFGNGSNLPRWMPGGAILHSRKQPGSNPAWQFDAQLPDDHFQRHYMPESARGGAHLCSMDVENGTITPITDATPLKWDFRATPSPDGRHIVFCRAAIGESPALWIADGNGENQRLLTRGVNGLGADHPFWLLNSN